MKPFSKIYNSASVVDCVVQRTMLNYKGVVVIVILCAANSCCSRDYISEYATKLKNYTQSNRQRFTVQCFLEYVQYAEALYGLEEWAIKSKSYLVLLAIKNCDIFATHY